MDAAQDQARRARAGTLLPQGRRKLRLAGLQIGDRIDKGQHLQHAMRPLSAILRRMPLHQSKKRPLRRALKAWNLRREA